MHRLAWAGAALVMLSACEIISSEDINTSGIYTDVRVEADGDGRTEVTTLLRTGGPLSNTFVDLAPGDRLVAEANGEERILDQTHVPIIDWIEYSTTFGSDAAGTRFTVSLERDADVSAPDSSATLPGPFELDESISGLSFSRASDEIQVGWGPFGDGDDMGISLSGSCVVGRSMTVSGDPGLYVISRGTIELDDDSESDTCSVTIEVSRSRDGSVDPAYAGGHAVAVQRRSLTITSTP